MLHFLNRDIDLPECDGTAREAGEVWRMCQGAQVAICSVWTHPEGAELRLTNDRKLKMAEATHHVWTLPTVALAWRARFNWIRGYR